MQGNRLKAFVYLLLFTTLLCSFVQGQGDSCPSTIGGDDKCICEEEPQGRIGILCTSEETGVADLEAVLSKLKDAGINVVRVLQIEGLDLKDGEKLPKDIFAGFDVREFRLNKCPSNVPMELDALGNQAENLNALYLRNCIFKEGPLSEIIKQGLTKLQRLSLQRVNIEELNDEMFKDLNELKHLILRELPLNSIKEKALDGLDKLETLELTDMPLFKDLSFGKLQKPGSLKDLSLARNGIINITKELLEGLDDLGLLDLHNNLIARVPAGVLALLKKLETLNLGQSAIEKIDPGAFDGLANLQNLSLADNPLKDLTKNAFKGLKNLLFLNMSQTQLNELGDKIFAGLPKLNELDLSKNAYLKASGTNPLAGLKQLQFLNLSDTDFGQITSEMLADVPKLQSLDLSNSRLHSISKDALGKLKKLRTLLLKNTGLNLLHGEALGKLKNLGKLDISGVQFFCDNHLLKFVQELRDQEKVGLNLIGKEDITCDYPARLTGTSIFELTPDGVALHPEDGEALDVLSSLANLIKGSFEGCTPEQEEGIKICDTQYAQALLLARNKSAANAGLLQNAKKALEHECSTYSLYDECVAPHVTNSKCSASSYRLKKVIATVLCTKDFLRILLTDLPCIIKQVEEFETESCIGHALARIKDDFQEDFTTKEQLGELVCKSLSNALKCIAPIAQRCNKRLLKLLVQLGDQFVAAIAVTDPCDFASVVGLKDEGNCDAAEPDKYPDYCNSMLEDIPDQRFCYWRGFRGACAETCCSVYNKK